MEYTFPVTRNTNPKPKPTDCKSLGFGKYFTDHMLIMDYDEGKGWHDGKVVPYGNLVLDPAAVTLHYGQMTFKSNWSDTTTATFSLTDGDSITGMNLSKELDYEVIAASKAVFWGYSDLSTVINAIYAKTGKSSVLYQVKNMVWSEAKLQRNRFNLQWSHPRADAPFDFKAALRGSVEYAFLIVPNRYRETILESGRRDDEPERRGIFRRSA